MIRKYFQIPVIIISIAFIISGCTDPGLYSKNPEEVDVLFQLSQKAQQQTLPSISGAQANLAQGKPTTASSYYSLSYLPVKSVDGNTDTFWISRLNHSSEYIQVDLGNQASVTQVTLDWRNPYFAEDYQIFVSPDSNSRALAKNVQNENGGIDNHTLSANGRYIRIELTRAYSSAYALGELKVYGSIAVPTPTPLQVEKPLPDIVLKQIHQDADISFTTRTGGALIYTGTGAAPGSSAPSAWSRTASITFSTTGRVKVFARAIKTGYNDSEVYSRVYNVVTAYDPAAGQPGSNAIHMDDTAFSSWANGHTGYTVGASCDSQWQTPDKACGKAVGSSFDIVCLGRGGQITMTFPNGIGNGTGYDFAIFENSFNDTFLELAFVEVSSNGTDFVRFDNASLTNSPVGAFGTVPPSNLIGLVSKYRQAYGTPYDLDDLTHKQAVVEGIVDLLDIQYVKIIDINGDGSASDSFGNPIYDPSPCVGSAGCDLDAVGVIYEAE